MSRIRHDSVAAEQLACFWHHLGAWLSGATAVVALAGMAWHIWAVAQHRQAIQDLEENP